MAGVLVNPCRHARNEYPNKPTGANGSHKGSETVNLAEKVGGDLYRGRGVRSPSCRHIRKKQYFLANEWVGKLLLTRCGKKSHAKIKTRSAGMTAKHGHIMPAT